MTDYYTPQQGERTDRDLIETISAVANCRASAEAELETLQDLSLPRSAKEQAEGALFGLEANSDDAIADKLFEKEDGFLSGLAIVLIAQEFRQGRRLAVVSRPFGYVRKVGKIRAAIVVPQRYVTDFASIPKFARWLIAPFGRHAEAAVIHDWLYAIEPQGDKKARKRADRVFRTALKDLGVGPMTRFIMYRSVRFGGSKNFGAPEELQLRKLDTLEPVTPRPDPEPLKKTVAFKDLKPVKAA